MSKEFTISSAWYNEDWDFRKSVLITGTWNGGTDYQVLLNVTYDSDMQVDFADLVFTDNDKITLLDHWVEFHVNSSFADVWVKVADAFEFGADVTIQMYYGNSEASTTSNGPATFLFYEDWTDETIGAQWTIETSDGTISFDDTAANHGSVIKVEGDAGSYIYSFYSDEDFNSSYALRLRSNTEKTVASFQSTKQGWNDVGAGGYAMIESYQGAARIVIRDDDSNTDHQNIADGNYASWHTFESRRDGTNTQWLTDGVEVAEGSNAPDVLDYHIFVYVRDSEYDTYNDWFVVRRYIPAEPLFDSFGSEEDNKAWEELNEVELVFFVLADLWAWDMFLILLGLCMIPASTVYLVYGGRNNFSTDKLFYGLIVFLMGWGLIIGGIM